MSEALDRALDELAPDEPEPRRWDDVLRRTSERGSHRRRGLALGLAAALVALGAGGAFHRDVVDFFRADPAPEPIRIDFAKMGARSKLHLGGPTMEPAGDAREVARFPADGKEHPLWVAPMKNGGYCYRWHIFGSCGRMPQQGDEIKLGLGGLEGSHGLNMLVGHVSDPAIHRLELEYADGERVQLPFVWVSKPIDAGFTAFQVPEERQAKGLHAVAVSGFDKQGALIERQGLFVKSDPQWEAAADGLPRIADRSKKRTLFDFRDETGAQWTLVVAPAPEGKLCYAFNRGGGCVSPKFGPTPLSVQGGGKTAFVCCTVAESVTKVELRFQDGDRIELEPAEGFLLAAVPSEHYPRGKRLEAIVSSDASGNELEYVKVHTDRPGLYPCTKGEEIDLGYGQTVCP